MSESRNKSTGLFIKGLTNKSLLKRSGRSTIQMGIGAALFILGTYLHPEYGFYIGLLLFLAGCFLARKLESAERKTRYQEELQQAVNSPSIAERLGVHTLLALDMGISFGLLFFCVMWFGMLGVDIKFDAFTGIYFLISMLGGLMFGIMMSCSEIANRLARFVSLGICASIFAIFYIFYM